MTKIVFLGRQVTDDSSQHSLIDGTEGCSDGDKPMTDELSVMDLRLKSETVGRDGQSQVMLVLVLLTKCWCQSFR